ncbi:MAG: hypothetical protein NTW32_17080 [Chloroflexi bacterium]|nr:hypothetical protein [Chloroflexota bacterium]
MSERRRDRPELAEKSVQLEDFPVALDLGHERLWQVLDWQTNATKFRMVGKKIHTLP